MRGALDTRGIRTIGLANAILIWSKAFGCPRAHTICSESFNFNHYEKAFFVPAKFDINLLRRLIFSMRLCNSLLSLGYLASRIASALFLSTTIICEIRIEHVHRHSLKCFLKFFQMTLKVFGLHYHIIYCQSNHERLCS